MHVFHSANPVCMPFEWWVETLPLLTKTATCRGNYMLIQWMNVAEIMNKQADTEILSYKN